jgi:hypothetical protein
MSILDAIQAAPGEPEFHGAGFIKLNLDEDGMRQLHVWSPELPPAIENGLIHDHTFTFKSEIIYGSILHEVYDELPGEGHSVWSPPPVVGGEWYRHESCELIQMGVYMMEAGSNCAFPSGKFHKILSHGAVTIMEKMSRVEGLPRVASDWPGPPEDAFGNKVSVSDMWRVIFTSVMAR